MFEDKRCIKCKRDSTSTARDKTKRKVKKKDKALYFNRDRDIRPGVDGSYIYVMSFEKGLYKVGMSFDVERRKEQIEKINGTPNGEELIIHYIGAAHTKETRKAESIAHYDLHKVNEIVKYEDGTHSREWFRCPLENLIFYLNLCVADMKEYEK